jgi:uncharacterized protein (TIGR02145 family)
MINNKKNKAIVSKIGIFSVFMLLAAISIYIYSPVIKTNAEGLPASITREAHVSLTANENMSLSLSTHFLSFEILSNGEGVFDSKSVTATVGSNIVSGFQLYLSADSTNPDLKDKKITDVISTRFDGALASSAMPANSWGYSTNGANYSRIPGLTEPARIVNVEEFTTDENKLNTNVSFGVKIDNTLAAGTYRGAVKFTLIGQSTGEEEPEPDFTTFSGIRFMNQMTPEICAAETTPSKYATQLTYYHDVSTDYVPTTYLRDMRDGKFYLVSKLADGNCWMDQGLRYLPKTTNTNEYTDLNTKASFSYTERTIDDWTLYGPKYPIAAEASHGDWSNHVWHNYGDGDFPDKYVNPIDNEYDIIRGRYGVYDGYGYSEDYGDDYRGYHYNWFAATGDNRSDSNTAVTSDDSICPKGWRLPAATGQKSFDNLITVYDVKYDYEDEDYLTDEQYDEVYSKYYRLMDSPLFFGLPGRYYSYGGYGKHSDYDYCGGNGTRYYLSCNDVGSKAYYWTADTMTNTEANLVELSDDKYNTTLMGAAKIFYIDNYDKYAAKIKDDPLPENSSATDQIEYINLRQINGYIVRCVAR